MTSLRLRQTHRQTLFDLFITALLIFSDKFSFHSLWVPSETQTMPWLQWLHSIHCSRLSNANQIVIGIALIVSIIAAPLLPDWPVRSGRHHWHHWHHWHSTSLMSAKERQWINLDNYYCWRSFQLLAKGSVSGAVTAIRQCLWQSLCKASAHTCMQRCR